VRVGILKLGISGGREVDGVDGVSLLVGRAWRALPGSGEGRADPSGTPGLFLIGSRGVP